MELFSIKIRCTFQLVSTVFYIMNARHPENVSIYAFKHLYLFSKASFFLQTETTNTRSLLFIAYHF